MTTIRPSEASRIVSREAWKIAEKHEMREISMPPVNMISTCIQQYKRPINRESSYSQPKQKQFQHTVGLAMLFMEGSSCLQFMPKNHVGRFSGTIDARI